MTKIQLNTARKVRPMIYAYTTPEIARHHGWTKIGYTERDVEERIKEQTHTANIAWNLEWKGNAVFEDGSYDYFTDKDFHIYLKKNDIKNEPKTEWFEVTGSVSRNMFYDFKANRGVLKDQKNEAIPYTLRQEQQEAVDKAYNYFKTHENGEFLWNCKPRFGKTLAAYDLVKKMEADKVLIVTNRPVIAHAWYDDYILFGFKKHYYFATNSPALKNEKYTVSSDSDLVKSGQVIEFESLQDIKGSKYFGGDYNKHKKIAETEWDVLIIDEAHEGVDTYRTDAVFDRIRRKHTLHLSGTPFKALANQKFTSDAVYCWTYADEQERKANWDNSSEEENPYANLPKMNLYTYQMSEIVRDELKQGIEIQGETVEYAFDLNTFFSVNENGRFIYDSSVDKFLDALTTQEKFPFSTPELRNEMKHTLWLLNRVESARQLAKKLENHPVFKDYKVILAAGDGVINDESASQLAYNAVVKAIAENDKTITISVKQLTTGITIPEWTGVLMLSSIQSASLYMQTAFRVQNPCLFHEGTEFRRKENCYVFDFDPARTLMKYEEMANDLNLATYAGSGDSETRKENIRKLLNFFPVIGEDSEGEMIELDAEKVLTIPRKIKSMEVVRRGFMSNFLFQNISNIFGAPEAALRIIEQFAPTKEQKKKVEIPDNPKEELSLDEDGDVNLTEEYVLGKEKEVFGEKMYGDAEEVSKDVEEILDTTDTSKAGAAQIKKLLEEKAISAVVQQVQEAYGDEMKPSDKRIIESTLQKHASTIVNKTFTDYDISKKIVEQERTEALQTRNETGKTTAEINEEADKKLEDLAKELQSDLSDLVSGFVQDAKKASVETVETRKKEREKRTIEDDIRDHLRGFSRTIPSFLMGYGDENTTLKTFDTIIPDQVFVDVTSITLDEFRFLRDGGDYTNEQTGEKEHFDGNLFDEVVFDDSVKEFLALKQKLANYFDENSEEDIFAYIPPQKTNQIFTPAVIVKQMADYLEQENPGCYDDPNHTFIDLYMKSGLYITEIVKRLFRSKKMKELFPDDKERLKHIFEKQVYGLAPTEIIYNISLAYILGFDETSDIKEHNIRLADATPYAKEGKLEELLEELYGK